MIDREIIDKVFVVAGLNPRLFYTKKRRKDIIAAKKVVRIIIAYVNGSDYLIENYKNFGGADRYFLWNLQRHEWWNYDNLFKLILSNSMEELGIVEMNLDISKNMELTIRKVGECKFEHEKRKKDENTTCINKQGY